MAKYIDLDAAIALAKDIIVPIKSGYYYRHRCIDPQELAELPAADVVERKTGKWIYDSEPYPLGNPYGHYGCDQCGESVQARTNFCPNCGADMRGEQDE